MRLWRSAPLFSSNWRGTLSESWGPWELLVHHWVCVGGCC